MRPVISLPGLPAGQTVAILDQPQGFEIVLRRGFERGVVAQRLHEMRDRPVVGALILGGEIVTQLRRAGAGTGQERPVEPDRTGLAENVEPVDLHGRISVRGEAGENRDGACPAELRYDLAAEYQGSYN